MHVEYILCMYEPDAYILGMYEYSILKSSF